MKSYLNILLVGLVMLACQIEDDTAPSPDDTFVKYYGELTSYDANDIEIVYDATGEVPEGFIVFGTVTTEEGDNDYYVLRTDLSGNLINSVSYGFVNQTNRDFDGDGSPDDFRGDEIAGQIQSLPGGGYVTVGTSSISESVLGISDFRIGTLAFLDQELQLIGDTLLVLASEEDDVELDLEAYDVIVLADGSFLVVGAKEFNRGGGVTDFDNFMFKFNFNSGVVFERTQGVPGQNENDKVIRAFEKENGNLVFIGYNNVPSQLGENGGFNGTNVYYLETDPNVTPVNPAVYGLDGDDNSVYNDEVRDAIETESGYSIVGTSTTSTGLEYGFIMNLSSKGLFLNSFSHDTSMFAGGLETRGLGVTQAINNDLIIVGQYKNFSFSSVSRGAEGLFLKVDQASEPVPGAESSFGLSDGADEIVDAVTLPDGSIVAVANVDFGGGVRLISIIKLNDNGSIDE